MDAHLRHLEKLYAATLSPTVGAQLVHAHLRRGDSPEQLGRIFPVPLVWDVMQGYEPGQNERLIHRITVGLDNFGWRSEEPRSAILGFHLHWRLRVVWPGLEIPYIGPAAMETERQSLILEDEPRVYPEPVLWAGNIHVAASGGRLSAFWTFTKHVPVRNIDSTLQKVDECVYNIYHGGAIGPEQDFYSGGGILAPDESLDQESSQE